MCWVLSDAFEPMEMEMALFSRFRRQICFFDSIRGLTVLRFPTVTALLGGGKNNFFPILSFPVVTIESGFL